MKIETKRVFIGRFGHQSDLLESLKGFCRKEDIKLGVFTVIGAVTCARMGYYDQENKRYIESVSLEKKLEITCCTGNISLKDNEPFVHAHITLADHEGRCWGGHLMPGAKIFAAEYHIQEFAGCILERKDDPETGLSLWLK